MKYFNDFIAESTILFDIDEYSELLDKYSSFKPYKGELGSLTTYNKITSSFLNKIEKLLRSQVQSEIEKATIIGIFYLCNKNSQIDEFYNFFKSWIDNIDNKTYLQRSVPNLIPDIVPNFNFAAILIDILNRSESQIQKLVKQAKVEISKAKNVRYSSKLINFANSKGVHPDVVLFAEKFIRSQTAQTSFIPIDIFPILKNLFVNPKVLPKQLYRGGKLAKKVSDDQGLSNDQLLKLVYDRKINNSNGQYSSWTTDKKLAITFSSAPEADYYRYVLTIDVNSKTLPFIIADLRQLTWSDYYAEQEILVDNNALTFASIEQIAENVIRGSHTFTESVTKFFFDPKLSDLKFPINIQEEISRNLNAPISKSTISDLHLKSFVAKDYANVPLFICLFVEFYSYLFPLGVKFENKTNTISWSNGAVIGLAIFKRISLNYSEIEIALYVDPKGITHAEDYVKLFESTKRVKINCRIEYT